MTLSTPVLRDPKTIKIENWFRSRNLDTYEHQLRILGSEIEQIYTNKLPTVLAVCPAGGKTYMSIAFIEDFLERNPHSRVLVLAHGTTVLKAQYEENILKVNPSFTHKAAHKASELNGDEKVVVTLPQTLNKAKKLPHFDLLVVDEAHQFYFAPMVQDIIKKTKVKYQLLLTGTPSVFVQKKYPIIAVTTNELLDTGLIADPLVELASSSYKFSTSDYNQDQDLTTSYKFRKSDTEATLDILLDKIVQRLTSIAKNNPDGRLWNILKVDLSWVGIAKKLNKTMIACNNQAQAKQVNSYFEKKGIGTALSISDTDINSDEIAKFQSDKNVKILIVVARGILGFNMPELENVIDMTGSNNIDRIYQLLSRVLRTSKDKDKFFFKVCSQYEPEYVEFVMTQVLCLTDRQYYLTYNGKNFLDMEIPVIKLVGEKEKGESSYSGGGNNGPGTRSVDYTMLPAIRFFKDLLHKNNEVLSSFAYVQFREVRNAILFGKKTHTLESCIASAAPFNSRSEWKKSCPNEYGTARKNKWLEECCVHMKLTYKTHTLESLKTSAAPFQSRSEWAKVCPTEYSTAKQRKYLNECCTHMKGNEKHTLESLKASAAPYKSRSEWRKACRKEYSAAIRMGYINKCCAHMKPTYKTHTLESCMKSATSFDSKHAWIKAFKAEYVYALKKGYLEQCCAHMKGNEKHTLESLKASAAPYKSRSEWRKACRKEYSAAHKHDWIEECCVHMAPLRKTHTLESLKVSAAPYKSRSEWQKFYPSEYSIALKKGWLEQCCIHMAPLRKTHTLESLKVSAAPYSSRNEWRKTCPSEYQIAYQNGWIDTCCAHMQKKK